MPKTDYTYSRSGSYSPKYLDKPYVSPNMSRRKLRGSVILTPEAKGQYSNTKIIITDTTSYDHIGSSYIENRLQENVNNSYSERIDTNYNSREQQNIDEYRDEVDHDGRLTNQSASSLRYRTSNGMVLRSGSHLHGVKAVIDSHTDKNRQYGVIHANSNKKSHQSNYLHSDITTSTITTYSSSSDSDHVKRKLDYDDTVNTNIIEKGSYETSEKSQHIKDSTARSQHSSLTTNSSINHLYGLDSDEEYSDEEINDVHTVSSDISEWSSYVENETITESFFVIFTAISTFFTDLAKSVTGTFLSLFSPLIYYFTEWLWKSSSVKSSDYTSTTDSRSSRSRTSKSFLYTPYNTEKKRRSKSCCLCLPCLLFLLPLLLLWGLYDHERITSITKTYFVPLLWIERNDTVIKEQVSQFDTYNLNTRVEQIVLQLQKQSSPSLSKSDVELIIQGLLEKQLTALRLDLIGQINNVRSDQSIENTEHSAKLNSLEMLLATAEIKATNLEQDLSQAKLYANIKGDEINTEALLKIEKLENQLKMMNADIGTLKHAQLNMMSSVQNCCRNDSFYSLTVRQQINDVLAGIVGGSGGNDGSDNVSSMFMTWLHGNYISKEEFESKMLALANDITEKILALEKTSEQVIIQSDSSNIGGGLDGGGLSEIFVRSVVEESLLKFSADRTGMADYALESGGGSIISIRCSETYYHKTALVSVFGIPLWYSSNSPRTVIQPDVHPGECWAFKGTKGYLVIQLANAIIPSGFTLEHIPKALSPTGNIKSAPREFTVYGLEREDSRIGISLGNYTYNADGISVQYFPVQMVHPKVFSLIELRIVNNYGNLEYTCLYRFRVHGTPQKL